MKIRSLRRDERLYLYLSGELDEHSAPSAREQADALIDGAAGLRGAVFDLSHVRFMDSTGIGFLLGRYKRLKAYGMEMFLDNPNAGTDKLLELSGLYNIMPRLRGTQTR